MTRNLCIVLGDQLSQNITSLKNLRKEDDKILMMEVVNEATYVNHHKKKLILIKIQILISEIGAKVCIV